MAIHEVSGLPSFEFPDASTLERWEAIDQRMTATPRGRHGGLYAAAVAGMTEGEAAEVASDLHLLASDVCDLWKRAVASA